MGMDRNKYFLPSAIEKIKRNIQKENVFKVKSEPTAEPEAMSSGFPIFENL